VRIRTEQLLGQLARTLAPLYLIFGDEPLLLAEASDAVRTRARELGYGERLVFHADTGLGWHALRVETHSPSLFSAKRLIELRLAAGKVDEAGAQFLTGYAAAPPVDCVLMVTAAKLDANAQKTAWFKAVSAVGTIVQAAALPAAQMPQWIRGRLTAKGLRPTSEAIALLTERLEGNLLAAAQEIEKLAILLPDGEVTVDAVLSTVTDSARFSIYELVDAALAGEPKRVVRIAEALQAEGTEAPLVLWALVRELRGLASMAHRVAAGKPMAAVLADHAVWERRKPLVSRALRAGTPRHLEGLLQQAARCDRIIKGMERGSPWQEIVALALALAGSSIPAQGRSQTLLQPA
jgi:DNA polymerase-3 subunit delta